MTINPAFRALDAAEWQPMTPPQRIAHAEEIREAEERGYWRGWAARELDCLNRHATVERAIDVAAQKFYLLEASDFHREQVGP